MTVQPAVKKETINVAKAEIIGLLVMFAGFFVLHFISPYNPDTRFGVPFDFRVIITGILGGAVAVLNFFLMGLSIQKMTETDDQDNAKKVFKAGYRRRMFLQIVWIIIALAVPFFHGAAGILPLLIPTFSIRMNGISQAFNLNKKTGTDTSAKDDSEPGKGAV